MTLSRLLSALFGMLPLISFSQNVGIGIDTPRTNLHVRVSPAGYSGFYHPGLSIEGADRTYAGLVTPNNKESGILFGNLYNNADGGIIYNNPSTPRGLHFRTANNNTRMAIDSNGAVGIGTLAPHPTAALEVQSNSKGFLPPRMNYTAIKAINNPAPGLQVYDTTYNCLRYYNGTRWVKLTEEIKEPSQLFGESVLYGTGAGNQVYAQGLATDAAGSTYTVGSFSGTATFGSFVFTTSNRDAFIVKYDNNGKVLWARQYGGPFLDFLTEVVVVNDEVYTTGNFSGSDYNIGGTAFTNSGGNEVVIIKLDVNGDVVWVRQANGSGEDIPTSIAADPSGNIYIGGHFSGSFLSFTTSGTLVNAGAIDGFIAKFNPAGTFQWVKNIGGGSVDKVNELCYVNNMIAFTGEFLSNSIALNSFTLNNAGSGYDIIVGKLDLNGHTIWAERYGGIDCSEYGNAICKDNIGNLYIAADFEFGNAVIGATNITQVGLSDGILLKLNTANSVSVYPIQSAKQEYLTGITHVNGTIYISGYGTPASNITVAGQNFPMVNRGANSDALIFSFNASNPALASQVMFMQQGSMLNDYAFAIAADVAQQSIYTTGRCEGTPAVMGKSMQYTAGYYLWRFTPGL